MPVQRSYLQWAVLLFCAILLAIFAYSNVQNASVVRELRADFCDYLVSVNVASHELPQVQGRIAAEAAQTELEKRLHCP